MSSRIDPILDPDAPPLLRAERPAGAPAQRPDSSKASGFLRALLWLILVIILLPPVLVIALKWLPPPTTAFMLQSAVKPVRYQWVPAAQIAEVARLAVVAAEDQKFHTHQGFDIEAIEKAYAYNQKAKKKKRGASTISQQVAKNLFLWPGGGYFRKGVEAGFTVLIETLWGKQRILEVYLNVAEFGPGIYGVEAASQAYFKKAAAKLAPEEAARLAAVLPSPRRWSVRNPGPYVQKRAGWVLRQMGYGRSSAEPPEDEPEPPPSELPELDLGTEAPASGPTEDVPEMQAESEPETAPAEPPAEMLAEDPQAVSQELAPPEAPPAEPVIEQQP